MPNPFTDHPAQVGETYGQHFAHASGFGFRMVGAGFACLIHAALPFLFVKTGSRTIEKLHNRMVVNRHSLTPGAPQDTTPDGAAARQ